jgi:hypothetical protein
LDAPSTLTKISASRTTPVAASMIGIFLPEKSTKALSPATWVCRMLGDSRCSNSRNNWQYLL